MLSYLLFHHFFTAFLSLHKHILFQLCVFECQRLHFFKHEVLNYAYKEEPKSNSPNSTCAFVQILYWKYLFFQKSYLISFSLRMHLSYSRHTHILCFETQFSTWKRNKNMNQWFFLPCTLLAHACTTEERSWKDFHLLKLIMKRTRLRTRVKQK